MQYLLLAILLFALYGSGTLSLDNWNGINVCPKILSIPACYLVLTLFVAGTVSHIFSFKFNTSIFYISVGIIALIALWGTITELSGTEICPRTSNGIPMCYYSLALSSSILLLKALSKSVALWK